MDNTVGAVTVPTIVAANHQTTSVSTNAINVNQSSNSHPHTNANPHPHIHTAHSSSSGSGSNSNSNNNISSSSINSSLIISSNSSSSSSSSSSASSGYGSTSATPTNSYETHTAATTPVAIAEPIIPIATVAAVSPYFSESITTQAPEGQHYAQHHQHQQQQQQQHQQHLNPQQQHQPQTQLHHHHHQLQQNLQHTQRQQQYYSSAYDYQQQQQQLIQQQQQPTHQQQQQSHNLPLTYNMATGTPAVDGGASTVNTSSSGGVSYQGVGQYKPTDVGSINYERNLTGRLAATGEGATTATAGAVTASTLNYTQQQPMQQQIPNELSTKHLTQSQQQQQQFLNATTSSKSRSASSLLGTSSSSSTTTKPQAAATPFYALPLAQQSNNSSSFYDNLKHKMPIDYHDNFVNFPNAAAAYHQQQKYYAAAKSQLKEASTYASGPPGLTGKSLYPNANNYYGGPTGQHASSGYDKYMYPSAYPPSLAYETPPDPAYRKGNTTSSLNSHSWPWGIDYASGNSRTIPPPTGHIPTATVAPTHASYLTANTSHLTRDPYYMAHDKYGMKYDKYPPPYQQTYVSPPATRHHLWPGTHSALSERLPPPPHTLHSTPYYSTNAPAALNAARQSCCTQPYQPQSCYYPPTRLPLHGQPTAMAQTSAYMGTAQPTAHPHQPHLSPLSSSCKYGSVIDYGAANKLKNPNDLYLSTHYDANPPPPQHLTHNHSYSYGTTPAASNQHYNPNQIHHGAQPAGPLITHESLVTNQPNFTNDLSLTSNTFDSYVHEPPHMNPQGLGLPSGPAAPGYTQVATKRALLDYRKPIQPQPPPARIHEECFDQAQNIAVTAATSSISANHYQSTDVLNTPETTTFIEYDTQVQATGYTAEESHETLEETGKSSEETTKNLSLRDFIANWNDDEEDYAANEESTFDQTTVIDEVLKATTAAETAPEPALVTKLVPESSLKTEEVPLHVLGKVSAPENINKIAEIVSEATSSADTDSSQYVNLPDIVIDIEKSNVAPTITTPPITGTGDASLLLDNFDVEKELDQLQLRKNESDSIIAKPNQDIKPTKDYKNDISPKSKDTNPARTSQISFEDLNVEQTKAVLTTCPTATDLSTAAVQSEQSSLRDIEGYESGNSRHSNESSLFEKEYETFINKITTIIPNSKSESEFEENVKEFSKFYKRKRKLREEDVSSSQFSGEDGKKLKSSDGGKEKNSNFPQVYTKKSRNRRVSVIQRLKQNQIHRRKPMSIYYKLIHSLRRYRRYRSKRVRDYIAELKEKHLPLIKRQSIKNYSIAANRQASPLFNPESLKTLVLSVINSEDFRDRLMNFAMEVSVESEEKHICTDPECDTCEVIRSLMEPGAFENSMVEQGHIASSCEKIDVSNENELIYMELQSDDILAETYDEALNQIIAVIPQDSQLITEQIIIPTSAIPEPYLNANETNDTKTLVAEACPDEFGNPNTLLLNNLESQHVEDYTEVQDLSMPQNKCELTSDVKIASQLEFTVNDSENFPENTHCRVPSVMTSPVINTEIPSVIQTTPNISRDVQNNDKNFETSQAKEDSTVNCPRVRDLLSSEINPEISSVIQKTPVTSAADKNVECNPKSSEVQEDSIKQYPKITELDNYITTSIAETSKNKDQDLEIPQYKSFEHQESKIKKDKVEIDSDSESESSECDTDCSCSSGSSSESSDEDVKDAEGSENNSSQKPENLKRGTSKLEAESCENVLRLSSIDLPKRCKVDAAAEEMKPSVKEIETTKLSCEPESKEEVAEHRLSGENENGSNNVPTAGEVKVTVTKSQDLKSPDRNSLELSKDKHVRETIESDSVSDSSGSDNDFDSSDSENDLEAKIKPQNQNSLEEKYTEAETEKYENIDSQNDSHPQEFKDASEEEDIFITKEDTNLTEQLQNKTQYRQETNSSTHLKQGATIKDNLTTNNEKLKFPQSSESGKCLEILSNTKVSGCDNSSSQAIDESHNVEVVKDVSANVGKIVVDISTDAIIDRSHSYQTTILKEISFNSEVVQKISTPAEQLASKSFLASNMEIERILLENPTPEKDQANISANIGHEEERADVSNTMDIQNIEPLDYSTLRENKAKEQEATNDDEIINISDESSSFENSQVESSGSEPVRPRIILSIKRTPEIVDTTKDATSSVELDAESKVSYEKYKYTTKFKSSNFTNDFSEESQSSFGTENDETENEEEVVDENIEIPRREVDEVDSKSKCNFSPKSVASSKLIFAKDNSISSKDFNSLNLSEIDERMGDLFPQSSFGYATPIFDIGEESRQSTESKSSVNSEAKDFSRSLRSLHNPEADNIVPSVGDASLEPHLISNTKEFSIQNSSILQHGQDEKQNYTQSPIAVIENPESSKSSEDSHKNFDDFVADPRRIDHLEGHEYFEDDKPSIASNLLNLIKNLPEEKANSSNNENAVLSHKDKQHPQYSRNVVENPRKLGKDVDDSSQGFDSYSDNDNENFASEKHGQLKEYQENRRPKNYPTAFKDKVVVNMQDNSLSSATSIEDYVDIKRTNINQCNDDAPECSMWNRVSVISFSHSNTEASDLQSNEEVISRLTAMDRSLDIFEESINSGFINSTREESTESSISDDDDSLDYHKKQNNEYNDEKEANDECEFNFHSIFGNLEKLVGVEGENEIISKQFPCLSTSQMNIHDVSENSAECKELEVKEVSETTIESISTNNGAFQELKPEVSKNSNHNSVSLEECVSISPILEKKIEYQETNIDKSEQTSGITSVIVKSDSPQSPANDCLLAQNEATSVTQLYESHASAGDNIGASLALAKVDETPDGEQLLEESPAISLENKYDTIVETFITQRDINVSSPIQSDTNKEPKEVLAETQSSLPVLSSLQSNTTKNKEDKLLEKLGEEPADNHTYMTPLSSTQTDASAEFKQHLEESLTESLDSAQTTSASSLTMLGALSDTEVDTVDVNDNLQPQECLENLQPTTSNAKEVRPLKEIPADIFDSKLFQHVPSPAQLRPSENQDVYIQEEHTEKSINQLQSLAILSQKEADISKPIEDLAEVQDVANNLHKPHENFDDFDKEVKSQDVLYQEALIPGQFSAVISPSDVNLLGPKNSQQDKCDANNQAEHSPNPYQYCEDLNKELGTQEDHTQVPFIPDQVSPSIRPRETNTSKPKNDPEINIADNKQEFNENLEVFNEEVELHEEVPDENFIPEQSSSCSREENTFRSKENALEDNCGLEKQEVADNLHDPKEYLEGVNTESNIHEELSEETFITEQSSINVITREAEMLSSKDDPSNSCAGDKQEVAENLQNSLEYLEGVNTESNTHQELSEETFISEQNSTTIIPRTADILSSKDDSKNSCKGDKEEPAETLLKSNEYFEDLNSESSKHEKQSEETSILEKSLAIIRQADTFIDYNQEVTENLHNPKKYIEDSNRVIESNIHEERKMFEETFIPEQIKEPNTHEDLSEETFNFEQNSITIIQNETDMSNLKDNAEDSSASDNQEVADNFRGPNEYLEDLSNEANIHEEVSEKTMIPEQSTVTECPTEADIFYPKENASEDRAIQGDTAGLHKELPENPLIPEQFPVTISLTAADTFIPKEIVAEDNCVGDNEKVTNNLNKPKEYFEDLNNEFNIHEQQSAETFIPEQSPVTISPRQADTFSLQENAAEDNCVDNNQGETKNFHNLEEYIEGFNKKIETEEDRSEKSLISEKSRTPMSTSVTEILRPENDAGDQQNVTDNLFDPKDNSENLNKDFEIRNAQTELTSIPKQTTTPLSPVKGDILEPLEHVAADNCPIANLDVIDNSYNSNIQLEDFSRNSETNESIEEQPVYPRFGRFKNYRSRRLENYNENTINDNSGILFNSKSSSPKAESQCYLESAQHPNRKQTFGYRGLVEERVTKSPCCEKPTDELPNVHSHKDESLEHATDSLAGSCEKTNDETIIVCADMEDKTVSSQPTNLSGQGEKSAILGKRTPELETDKCSLQSDTNIVTSPIDSKFKDDTISKNLENLSEDAAEEILDCSALMVPTTPQPAIDECSLKSIVNIVAAPIDPKLKDENFPEDTAEEKVDCTSSVDTTMSDVPDALQYKSNPIQDSSKLSTDLSEEITTTTTTSLDKTSTTDDVSVDFLGFKNQSSFEDESGEFHGFEDQYEEERIRREIENLNDDSAANDAFPYLGLEGKTSSHSSSMSSDLNELEALEKELSQHRLIRDLDGQDEPEELEEHAETGQHLVSESNVCISTNDIEHIKKMLESDEEHADNDESKDNSHKDDRKCKIIAVKENLSLSNACDIPKLSDLCRAALNSSLIVNNLTTVQSSEEVNALLENTTPVAAASSSNALVIERELSVEEALAEMYRQAGVMLSDPEDTDNAKSITNEEAQDVLLINLQEILNSDNDNVYVLQCDMNVNAQDINNENHLYDDNRNGNVNDVNGNGNANNTTERVNTLQLIGILNTDLENPEIHIISSDSESEVIILSDCDTDVEFHSEPFSPQPPSLSATTTAARALLSTREYIPFIDDLETNDDSQSDLSTIHHEEIVPDNLNKFLKEEFYRYLHEKYAQKKLSKYYHANRILRKYKKRYSNKCQQ